MGSCVTLKEAIELSMGYAKDAIDNYRWSYEEPGTSSSFLSMVTGSVEKSKKTKYIITIRFTFDGVFTLPNSIDLTRYPTKPDLVIVSMSDRVVWKQLVRSFEAIYRRFWATYDTSNINVWRSGNEDYLDVIISPA